MIEANAMDSTIPFITCPGCEATWNDLAHFVVESPFETLGFSTCFEVPYLSKVHFRHRDPDCGEVFSLPVGHFRDLTDEPGDLPLLTDHPACPQLCKSPACLEACGLDCRMTHVRTLMAVLCGLPTR
jgi:hypothetical protein